MKNAFDGFIRKLDKAGEEISELYPMEMSQTEKQRGTKE